MKNIPFAGVYFVRRLQQIRSYQRLPCPSKQSHWNLLLFTKEMAAKWSKRQVSREMFITITKFKYFKDVIYFVLNRYNSLFIILGTFNFIVSTQEGD